MVVSAGSHSVAQRCAVESVGTVPGGFTGAAVVYQDDVAAYNGHVLRGNRRQAAAPLRKPEGEGEALPAPIRSRR
jgi:hypothetical protein